MKKYVISLLFVFVLFSCDRKSQEPMCFSHEVTILELEKEIDKLFQENGRLKEQLENCERFLKEKDTLNFS